MTSRAAYSWIFAGVMAFLIAASNGRAQTNNLLAGVKDLHATDFTSEQYFEPPNEQLLKLRLSGSSAQPLPGGLLDVSHLKIEIFNTNRTTLTVVRAPQCTFAPLDGVASSAGHLELQSGDGRFHVEGDGFLWRQNESWLAISNRVRTVIEVPK